ncbi:hypothetical protein AVEN_94805-1 [Araneus ventricosus]|uniref:Uncharacterized protein n=1 Tax=Araneus ventricosus TaxID=182803 RepID=A0A4Y2CMA0_ARAVE|nr:hypothetical protein AVEN_94805-1 [Araneus ventricosus]
MSVQSCGSSVHPTGVKRPLAMDSKKRTFDLYNPNNVKEIHRLLFGDQSDTNSGDDLQVRDQDSEAEQSDVDSSSEDEHSDNDT